MRKFLTIVLPLLLPFLLYWFYLMLARRKASAAGAPAPAGWQEAPWVWIASAGVALLIVSLVVFGLTSGVDPGTQLVPPTWVDGEIVPSHPVED